MHDTDEATLRLSCVEQLSALTSPVRRELVEHLQEAGPCSIRELAAQMARPADGLYHHVRRLLKVGVLLKHADRHHGRRTEAVYTLAAPRVAGALEANSPASRRAVTKAATATLRLATAEFAAAVSACKVAAVEGCPNARVSRQKAWLTPSGLMQVLRLLGRLERLLTAHSHRRQGGRYSVTVALVPLVKRRRI
jgi:hypothetical protein